MTARKTSTLPTRIWKFAARVETTDVASEILWRSSRYYNRLVEIERARTGRYSEIRRQFAPTLAALEAQWEELDQQVEQLYRDARAARQTHWRESGGERTRFLPPEYEARKVELTNRKLEVSKQAKPLRAEFAAQLEPGRAAFKERSQILANGGGPRTKSLANATVLKEMLSENEWNGPWRAVATSDNVAHTQVIHARRDCKIYAGTYLGVEQAFARAKTDSAPKPPRFQRHDGGGRILVQLKKGTTWASLSNERVTVERLAPRDEHRSPRSRMVRITLDQTPTDDGAPMKIIAICRLHREPPADAEVKWLGLVFRRVGRRSTCLLQLTMEHASFADPKRPAGSRSKQHVRIGWSRLDDGIRVAQWPGGVVVCPDRILRQNSYAASIESATDRLYGEALRRLRAVTRLAGHRLTAWHRMGSDRARAQLRSWCEQYAEYVFGVEGVRERWRAWVLDRKSRREDLYAPMMALRAMSGGDSQESFAWWCWIWARKVAHLDQLAVDSRRRFTHRRDAHYRADAIRLATEFVELTIDNYSIAKLKELPPLTMPGEGVRDMAQSQLHSAAPGRFREILLEVMGPRCTPCERPSEEVARKPKGKRKSKTEATDNA
jgi:hypothetical protein